MNEDIKVQIGEPEEKSVVYNPKMKMALRKSLAGDYIVSDHADLDIVVQPEKKQVLAFPKNEMSDDVYAAQDRLFDFLARKGVLVRDSVQAGNVYGTIQATYPEATNGANETEVVIYSIGRFIEEEKPYYTHDDALEDAMVQSVTNPSEEDSTELGEVPQEVEKGTVPKYPAIKSYYRVYQKGTQVLPLTYFILSSFGLTQILVYGSIFNPIRPTKGKLGELFRCPMCLGFWVGLFLWSLNSQTELFSFDYSPLTAILLGCLSSGTSYIIAMLFDDNGLKISK